MEGENVVTGALSSGLKLYSVGDASEKRTNGQPIHIGKPCDLIMENSTQSSAVEARDGPPTVMCNPNGAVSLIPDYEISGAPLLDVANDSGQRGNEDERSSAKKRKGKGKFCVSVSSSWSLRSKSQEKHKSPEPNEIVIEEGSDRERRKRGRKKLIKERSLNEFLRIRSHFRYLLHRIKYEQTLIDAYNAEGWKGQSLEKLKPEKELQRAKSHILRYKLKIRSLFEHLDQLLLLGRLPGSLFDSKGEIDSEDIFCAKCGSKDLTLDNDIILCDGACERGFHQYCLEPPLLKEDIPPGDEGWICPGCDCKLYCIDMLKDYHSAKVSLTDSWENIFPEAARAASGDNLDAGSGSSDDSEDEDYDPYKPEASQKVNGDKANESECFPLPDNSVPAHNNQLDQGHSSEESDDDDFDPTAPHKDGQEQVETSSSSSDFSSDSEDLCALLKDEASMDVDSGHVLPSSNGQQLSSSGIGKRQSLKEEISFLQESVVDPVSHKRRVPRLDYKKLHDEDFGNSSSDSSDEDFEDASVRKKRKTHPEKTEVNSPKGISITKQSIQWDSTGEGSKRAHVRLGEATKQKLQSAFVQNMYPEKCVKEKLANELGISIRQVSRWFETARWSLHHRPKMESTSKQNTPDHQPIPDGSSAMNDVPNSGTRKSGRPSKEVRH